MQSSHISYLVLPISKLMHNKIDYWNNQWLQLWYNLATRLSPVNSNQWGANAQIKAKPMCEQRDNKAKFKTDDAQKTEPWWNLSKTSRVLKTGRCSSIPNTTFLHLSATFQNIPFVGSVSTLSPSHPSPWPASLSPDLLLSDCGPCSLHV